MAVVNEEVWQNTTKGYRWYKAYGVRGEVLDQIVKPGQAFVLSTEARRYNQQLAANARLDLFRNGAFSLKQSSKSTVKTEIESQDSLTDQEILDIVTQVQHGQLKMAEAIENITSDNTLVRLYDAAEASGMHHAKYKSVLRNRMGDHIAAANEKLRGGRDETAVKTSPAMRDG